MYVGKVKAIMGITKVRDNEVHVS